MSLRIEQVRLGKGKADPSTTRYAQDDSSGVIPGQRNWPGANLVARDRQELLNEFGDHFDLPVPRAAGDVE